MTDDRDDRWLHAHDTGRILREALEARARVDIGDFAVVPPMREAGSHRSTGRRTALWAAPLAVAAVLAAAIVAVALSSHSSTSGHGTLAEPSAPDRKSVV